MACYHLKLKVMSRKGGTAVSAVHGVAYRSGGKGATVSKVETVGGVSAVAAAAYRSGESLRDDRLGTTYDYRNKEHILHTEIMLPDGKTPAWASNRVKLWNEVERAEKRKDAVVAREVEFMLSRENSMAENLAEVRSFAIAHFVSKGLAVDFSIHQPDASDGDKHPHCHMMFTPRALTAEGFSKYKDQTFWWASQGEKSKDELEKLRADWARRQNALLERVGSEKRVDHRSLAVQRAEAQERAAAAKAAERSEEAATEAKRAKELDRVPQVPLGLSRRVETVSGHLHNRISGWHNANHHHRVKPLRAMLAKRGKAELLKMCFAAERRALEMQRGTAPPAPERGFYDR